MCSCGLSFSACRLFKDRLSDFFRPSLNGLGPCEALGLDGSPFNHMALFILLVLCCRFGKSLFLITFSRRVLERHLYLLFWGILLGEKSSYARPDCCFFASGCSNLPSLISFFVLLVLVQGQLSRLVKRVTLLLYIFFCSVFAGNILTIMRHSGATCAGHNGG